MTLNTPRLRREFRTMEHMVAIYCVDKHGPQAPCEACREFLAYAEKRLEKCPYGEDKPTCAKCPVHCYKKRQRDMAKEIMRYAGPRMTWRHPWLALLHVLDKFRNVQHPMALRGSHRDRSNKPRP